MEQPDEPQGRQDHADPGHVAAGSPRRLWRKAMLFVCAVLVALGGVAWFSRERIANDVIAGQLTKYGIPATYEIESIGPDKQVLRNLVVGNKDRPDLTIERVSVFIRWRFGMPGIRSVELLRPRLFGTLRKNKLSFGSLDPLLFDQPASEAPALPDLALRLVDGRALLETDYGPVGFKAEGNGNLSGGFKGMLAANAPQLMGYGCDARKLTLYAAIATSGGKPEVSGPLRLQSLTCPEQRLALGKTAFDVDARGDADLAGLELELKGKAARFAYAGSSVEMFSSKTAATWRNETLTARYDAALDGLATNAVGIESLTAKGSVRARQNLERLEWQADWAGKQVRLADDAGATLRSLEQSSEGSFLAPMVERFRRGLGLEGRGSTLLAQTTVRKTPDGLSLVMPQGTLRGGTGATLLAISRLQFAHSADRPMQLSGNFITGGTGIPQLSGRFQRDQSGRTVMRGTMREYRAGEGSLQLPQFAAVYSADGNMGFAGSVRASGPLPGGSVDNLVIPVNGRLGANGDLSVWPSCFDMAFDKLAMGGLDLDRRSLKLCPSRGGAIVRNDRNGLRIAAGTPGLELSGALADSPISIKSGPVGVSWPGRISARDLSIALGPQDATTRFDVKDLKATFARDLKGDFSGADVRLFQVPIDVLGAAGSWAYSDGRFSLANVHFEAEDRETLDRFEPMEARGATLGLADGIIDANVPVFEPESGRSIMDVGIRHDLNSGEGDAALRVPGIRFDSGLQPDMLTGLALGVIANAQGEISGDGLIRWGADEVTSTGRFRTDAFDFAAAFGPVKGVSGEVVFSDLLGFVTERDQKISIGSINPGIEVENGVFFYEIQPGQVFVVRGADWPFMDGTLHLQPTRMVLGASEVRHFTLEVNGLDAAVFVQRMELANIMATGKFDGQLPLIFDEDGGRIEGGSLVSRPPGGNVSYVGELTYEDLSAMGNFAFDALKSIDYQQMQIDMDGSLAGEIVTRVGFEGLSQGQLANKNFLTRQVAKLPIRFVLNIRAPFFSLFGSFKSLYDPTLVADPVSLGLIDRSASSHSPDAKTGDGLTVGQAAATTAQMQGRQQ